jgi:hypothetical protein
MPPKKVETEVDVSLLPKLSPLIAGLNLNIKQSRANKLVKKITENSNYFQKIISR